MSSSLTVHAEPEFMPWGNLTGIRIDGERVPFEASLRAVMSDWSGYTQSSKFNWEGHQTFRHEGDTQVAIHAFEGLPLTYTLRVRDVGGGAVDLTAEVEAQAECDLAGVYLTVALPPVEFGEGQLFVLTAGEPVTLPRITDASLPRTLKGRGFHATSGGRDLECTTSVESSILIRREFTEHPAYLNDPKPRQIFATKDARGIPPDVQIYFPLATGLLKRGDRVNGAFRFRAQTQVDRRDVVVKVDPSNPGRPFTGIGGNFRLQFPDKDPAVIDYCLAHLRVTWGRIALYWRDWQPEETQDPIARAKAGGLSPLIRQQMELAQKLARHGIPIIVSVWDPPRWAADPWPNGERGEALKREKLGAITDSIANYLLYLKDQYGVEATMFSFNETDVGVEVRETAEDHALHARAFGEKFADRGLATKMLLGDTGHGTAEASELVSLAEQDPVARRYAAAVAFHTYHGCTPRDLTAWTELSRRLRLPLMVTEGGPDSAAHRYPQVFIEPWFAQLEADTYIRIASTCEPETIMPWQLTSDYSVLQGEGIYGVAGPLRPTQRFWIVKQLGDTPPRARWLPTQSASRSLSAAAFIDEHGACGVHLVNNGASRTIVLQGVSPLTGALRAVRTDGTHGMEEMATVTVGQGEARVLVPAGSYVTLYPRH